jgi:hypothetical protein
MALGSPQDISPETLVHRVGGGGLANLRLSELDRQEIPPGISVLLGGTPAEAAEQMRQAFPRSRKWQAMAGTVGSTTAAALRQAGFDVAPDPTTRFPNHARVIHPDGIGGFVDENLTRLVQAFHDTLGY